jgi:hypothetical protein
LEKFVKALRVGGISTSRWLSVVEATTQPNKKFFSFCKALSSHLGSVLENRQSIKSLDNFLKGAVVLKPIASPVKITREAINRYLLIKQKE